MRIKSVKRHVFRDFAGLIESDTSGVDADADKLRRDNYTAFCCLLYHPDENRLYCGMTGLDSNILAKFNPETSKFESLDYRPIAEPYEVKIHRSLELSKDGTVYGATSCLYSLDKRLEAPGGSVFRITPGATVPEKLVVPMKHDYIQTITLDDERRLIYGLTYPVFKFFVYHIDTGEVEDYDYVGSITHISAIDDDGCFWSTWDSGAHHLFKYDPSKRAIEYFHHGLPNARAESNMMYAGAGPVDIMINGGDGYLYIGTTGGSLCRLDPRTAEVTYLGKPVASTRLPGLIEWHDSLLLGCCGDNDGGCVFAYDREKDKFHVLGPMHDSDDGFPLFRVHDIRLVSKDRAFVAETDAPNRSSYLWECELEL